MALCRAACLRPFVSLREFRVAVRRPPTTRPPCRPLAAAAANPPPPPPAGGTTAVAATPAAGAASTPAPKYDTLTAEQQAQVDAYLDILLDWNTRMNLTAVRDRSEAYERHVNDSLALLPAIDSCLAQQQAAAAQQPQRGAAKQQQQRQPSSFDWERGGGSRLPAKQPRAAGDAAAATAAAAEQGGGAAAAAAAAAGARLIDVGSGAGLPGIILAIARPDWEVTLLDSLQKRCKFNEAAIEAAGLSNVRVHWARAEDAGQAPALRQAYDVAIARAVAELRVLAELCLPLVRPGGHWVAAKGPAPHEEVDKAAPALGKLGGKLVGVQEVDSESPEGRRTAVVVLKARSTPAQYPRKPGVPGKKPL